MRVLIIEDDIDTQSFLKERLEEKCFAVDTANDGTTGARLAKTNDYDIVLLDYALPGKNGFSICKELRSQERGDKAHLPIIMISVTDESPHIVNGFDLGIDDYVKKPFFFNELHARMQAVLRRPQAREENILSMDDLVLDNNAQKVTRAGKSIYLTRKEFSLLEYLLKNKGTVVSRGAITEHVWDMNVDPFSNTIEMHILNLRKKLNMPDGKKLIHSIPGRGYKLDTEK